MHTKTRQNLNLSCAFCFAANLGFPLPCLNNFSLLPPLCCRRHVSLQDCACARVGAAAATCLTLASVATSCITPPPRSTITMASSTVSLRVSASRCVAAQPGASVRSARQWCDALRARMRQSNRVIDRDRFRCLFSRLSSPFCRQQRTLV